MTNVDVKPDEQAVKLADSAFGSYHRVLHRFLVRRLMNATDASDVMQEVFLRVLRLERVELVRNPQAYLYGIASHVVREFRARERRERVSFDSQTTELQAENPRDTVSDELADNLDVERKLEHALAQLPPAGLRILVYDLRDGLSHEEIAQKMGLSVHTVKKYFFRSLALVRTDLKRLDRQE